MNNLTLIQKMREIATNYKTLYVMGCFGAPLNAANKKRYTSNHQYNRNPERTRMINAASDDTFGFDCVCLIKGVLWGWSGDKSKTYGGAVYASNGVPDIGADSMIQFCIGVSSDFSKIIPGELVWLPGHVGIYIGDGLVVECSPKWANRVQITALANIGGVSGYNARRWDKHGCLPYIEYNWVTIRKTIDELAKEVIDGAWGTGMDRKNRLSVAGYDYSAVQKRVNELLAPKPHNGADQYYSFLKAQGFTDYAASGIYANLYVESGMKPTNLQNTYEKKIGMDDVTYTAAVDSGAYTNFVKDAAGYGLAQWTYWSRKQKLLEFARSERKSIGDGMMQMRFLMKELSVGLIGRLNAAQSASEAAKMFMLEFERPGDQSERAQNGRAKIAEEVYNKWKS